MYRSERKQKMIVILGPTAVGKSTLAVRLARKLTGLNQSKRLVGRAPRGVLGEVVSADSRQVYKGLDIGTGKITKREMRGVRHHLLDVASPRQQYSVARYVRDANRAIGNILARGKLPIICGGTSLYIDALLDAVSFPDVPPDPKLRKRLAAKTTAELFRILQRLDPARAKRIDRHNPRRLVRAIEIAKSLHVSPSVEIRYQQPLLISDFNSLKIGLKMPRTELRRRIQARLCARLRRGMMAEVKRLQKNGLSWRRLESFGLEYRYLAFYLQNKITKEQMIEKLNTKIWRYAKRQMTWWKRDKKIKWFFPSETRKIEWEARLFSSH